MQELYEMQQKQELIETISFLEALAGADKETLIEKLNERIKWLEDQIAFHKGALEPGGIEYYDGDFAVESPRLLLRRPISSEKEIFLGLKAHYSFSKHVYENEITRNSIWDEHIGYQALYCSILNNEYIGYCGIKNLQKNIWEIAIELKEEACHKGNGYEALSLFLAQLRSTFGHRVISSRIEPDNIASQNLFEKLGFKPFGLSDFLLHTDEEKRRFEEKYADRVDENLRKLAEKFNVEPVKLLSHVVEYRLEI